MPASAGEGVSLIIHLSRVLYTTTSWGRTAPITLHPLVDQKNQNQWISSRFLRRPVVSSVNTGLPVCIMLGRMQVGRCKQDLSCQHNIDVSFSVMAVKRDQTCGWLCLWLCAVSCGSKCMRHHYSLTSFTFRKRKTEILVPCSEAKSAAKSWTVIVDTLRTDLCNSRSLWYPGSTSGGQDLSKTETRWKLLRDEIWFSSGWRRPRLSCVNPFIRSGTIVIAGLIDSNPLQWMQPPRGNKCFVTL